MNPVRSVTLKTILSMTPYRDIKDIHGWTALHYAVYHHNVEGQKALENAGASPFSQTKYGTTPTNLQKQQDDFEFPIRARPEQFSSDEEWDGEDESDEGYIAANETPEPGRSKNQKIYIKF
mmetsp:Transcript_8985/g.18120  ORF Transcript_8985/g.18120 Transcript_8985/m.18120 type:complete len:121 (+) Transcript_8985:2164-2526(+)